MPQRDLPRSPSPLGVSSVFFRTPRVWLSSTCQAGAGPAITTLAEGRWGMEKQLTIAAYWIGIASTVVALITRALATLGMLVFPAMGGTPISYRTFLEGAELFFLMAIAGSALIWVKSNKT